jgi:hypothetical protein
MTDRELLPWETKLLAAGMPEDEVEYRRYREEKLLHSPLRALALRSATRWGRVGEVAPVRLEVVR